MLWSLAGMARSESLYFIYPDAVSSDGNLKSGLKTFFDYLATQTKSEFSGDVYKDSTEAVTQFEAQKVNMAVVSPEFFQTYRDKFNLKRVADIIPLYSEGPYEKLYIMIWGSANVENLLADQTSPTLYSTQKYDASFLQEKIFHDDETMRQVIWQFVQTPDVLSVVKVMAASENGGGFVLLTGTEFFAVQKMRKTDESLRSLKLVFTSPDLPSSSLVIVEEKIAPENLQMVKRTLLGMSDSLNGLSILKKLRVKGFAEVN